MNRNYARLAGLAVGGAALAVSGLAGAGAASATHAAATYPPAAATARPAAVPGSQLWVARYSSRGKHEDAPSSVAASRRGNRVFVTGTGWRSTSGSDYVTVAYSALTGRRLWVARYSSRGKHDDAASSVAVSRAGTRVFVTGTSNIRTTGGDYATVAYNAATGKQLWAAIYHGPASGYTSARSVAVSPDGSRVFVTGTSAGRNHSNDYATVAYNVATGKQLWVRRFSSLGATADSVVVSPNGRRVFVTGTVRPVGFVTIAYSSVTGRLLWLRHHRGGGNFEFYTSTAAAVSPGGSEVFVSGTDNVLRYVTVAYNAATGKQLWVALYGQRGENEVSAMAVSPTGTTVVVTGHTSDGTTTVAYNSLTGARLWAASYNGPQNLGTFPSGVAVSPDGSRAFVTGRIHNQITDSDYATVAYNASTGAQLWAASYNGPGPGGDSANAITVSGRRVFVTGSSDGKTTDTDYATVAYNG